MMTDDDRDGRQHVLWLIDAVLLCGYAVGSHRGPSRRQGTLSYVLLHIIYAAVQVDALREERTLVFTCCVYGYILDGYMGV